MQEIFRQSEKPLSEIEHVAVAVGIGQLESPHQLHSGIIHVSSGQSHSMLHLAWHTFLLDESPEPHYFWVVPNFAPARLRQVATLCRRIFRKNQQNGLPYGFGTPNDQFDPQTGELLFKDSQYGLTCASFVLAVFDAAGLRLANYETWPDGRDQDIRWQHFILSQLRKYNAPNEHVKNVETEVGAVRFHPQQVTACAAYVPPPLDFQLADDHGKTIGRFVFDQQVERLAAEFSGYERLMGLINEVTRLFDEYAITPFELLGDDEDLVSTYKSEFNPERILKIRFLDKDTHASISENDLEVMDAPLLGNEKELLECLYESVQE